ncbi:MAG TPA: hypothetical protein VIT87_07130 [Gemmatimonadales bacterium]
MQYRSFAPIISSTSSPLMLASTELLRALSTPLTEHPGVLVALENR